MSQTTNQKSNILGLMAETAIHAGSGESNGVVDLPIMREKSTGWPCVFGSAVKGAMRAAAEKAQFEKESIFSVFGPDTNGASEHAGSIMIADARLLLLPVRSLTGQYRLVTCPDLLKRWQRDTNRCGIELNIEIPQIAGQVAKVAQHEQQSQLFLEEYAFEAEKQDFQPLIEALATIAGAARKDDLQSKLAIISNDSFNHLLASAIPVNAHIALDSATKTVKPGALWYEETLPAETLLYVVVNSVASRNRNQKLTADQVMAVITDNLFGKAPYLQLGGNETTGMGWCKVSVAGEAA